MDPRPLPSDVAVLLADLRAPPRLVAHLTLVHDVAAALVDALRRWPTLAVDGAAVTFGAATHDIGKAVHPTELTTPGHQHAEAGETLLRAHGVPPALSRFARTHCQWRPDDARIEDLLIALADTVWKGKRDRDLEDAVGAKIGMACGLAPWEVFAELDDILDDLARDGDARLTWQARYPVRA